MSIAAVVLAAGEASRFGTPKQRLLLPEVLERLDAKPRRRDRRRRGGPHARDARDRRHLRGLEARPGCVARERPRGARRRRRGRGRRSRRRPGSRARSRRARDRVVARGRRQHSSRPRTAGSAATRCSSPARRGTSIPDAGLRDLDVRLVPCDDLGAPGDVDTPADLPGPALADGYATGKAPCARPRPRRRCGAASASPSARPASAPRPSSARTDAATPRSDSGAGSSRSRRDATRPGRPRVGELAVEVALQQLLARVARRMAHEIASSASFCFSSRRPRCSRDITVPIGMSRIWAASA